MSTSSSGFVGLLLAALIPASASAQVIEPPPRASTGILGGDPQRDPNAAQQQISLTLNMLGGYSDNIVLDAQGTTTAFSPRRSGTTGTGSATVNYSRLKGTSSIDAMGRALVNSFSAVDSRLLVGGEGALRGRVRVFSRTTVSGALQAQSRPTFGFMPFGAAPIDVNAIAPGGDPLLGLARIRSLASSAVASVAQEWTSRQTTSVSASHMRTSFGREGLDMRSTAYDLTHTWSFARNLGLQLAARRTMAGVLEVDGSSRPLDSDFASIGLDYTRNLSPTRSIRVEGGPAATRVRTISIQSNESLEYIAPSGFLGVAFDLGRTWAVSADWRREAMLIDGLVRQSFLTDSGVLSLGGAVTRNIVFAASGSYATGSAHEGEIGSFDSVAGTAQVQYLVSRCCSIVGLYTYTQYQLRDLSAVPEGFPNRIQRGAVQAGVTVWLPLYGAFQQADRPGTRR